MKKFHIIKIQLQWCTWVTSKKVSHCLGDEKYCIWRRNSDVIDSCDLTFRQVFTKHMVDQSITQLWKNVWKTPYLSHFFVNSQPRIGLYLNNVYPALFVWNTFFVLQITLFYKLFCSNQYLLHLFSRVWRDPMTSSYLERAADIHVCLQYWVFCSTELWFPFYCLWSVHLSFWGISHFLTLFFSAYILLFSESLKCAYKRLSADWTECLSQQSVELSTLLLCMNSHFPKDNWGTNCPLFPFWHTGVYWLQWR